MSEATPGGPRFVYHLGVHKTGSTLLQRNLALNKEALAAQGVRCINTAWPNGLEKIRHRVRRLQNEQLRDLGDDVMESLNSRFDKQATTLGARMVLISEENFLGVPIHRELSWAPEPARFYPTAERCLKGLTYGIAPGRVKVILYSRRLEGVLRGHYFEALRALATADTFEAFLGRVDIESFRFDDLMARLRRALPGATFVVKPFESIRAGAEAFVRDFLLECGIDPAPLTIEAEKVNPGLDAAQAEELRRLGEQMAVTDRPRPLRRRAREIQQTPGDPGKPLLLPEAFRGRIAETMRGDLSERLAAEFA